MTPSVETDIATSEDNRPILTLDAVNCVNFASAQNDIPIVRRLSVENPSDEALTGLTVRLSASPLVIRPKSWAVDRLGPQGTLDLSDLSTPLDLAILAGLDESERGRLTVTLEDESGVLATHEHRLDLLAKDQWGGLLDMDRLLAAYVSPNDPVIAGILKEASRMLQSAGYDGAIEGYQSGDPGRAWMIAGAIWSAATALNLTYANPPASFETNGQKVRFPDRIKREGLATCLDTSLLLAAAWEQAGLNPVVLFSHGHAFAGVWLTQGDFGYVTEPDVLQVRKAVQAREFVALETTYMTKRPAIGFEEAVDAGRIQLSEEREHEFTMAIDISRARTAHIRPLASHIAPDGVANEGHVEGAPAGLPKPLAYGMQPENASEPAPDTPKGRIERWQSKLLDLSLRNRLLNFKTTKQTVPCRVPDVSKLEDALADGKAFKAYPLLEEDPIGERRVAAEEREGIIASTVADAYARGQVTIDLTKPEMDKRLLTLFRKAKSDMQEGGTNTLFMAAGFLRWQREGESKYYRAPLLLIPIKLERRSAKSEFLISHHEDEVRFNSTLLEFLKRDFDLSLTELEGELPQDESGIDLPRILNIIRTRVRDVPRFEVIEDVAISTFSFAKYLMWKDLVDRTDELRNNRLVAHLVDNPEHTFDTGSSEAISPEQLDNRLAPRELMTPLPADSSQLAAVVAANEGRDFVLIGPPGTGKSQTIANIISQCIAHGKTVLFVAEKAAALDVVRRRLEAHGLGDAVLELHSNKTDRKRVVKQLGRGWDRASAQSEGTWIEVNEKLRVERDLLNEYVRELHTKGRQGFSIFEALGWAAPAPKGFVLSFNDKDAHDAGSFARLQDIADTLERTHSATGDIPPLKLIAATDWSFAWQDDVLQSVSRLRTATDRMVLCGREVCKRLGLRMEGHLALDHMTQLDTIAKRISADAVDLRAVPDLSRRDLTDVLEAFSARVKQLDTQRSQLGAIYSEPDILRMPLDALDADWRAVNAKFWPFSALGRRRLTKLLQSYAQSGQATPNGDISALRQIHELLKLFANDPISVVAGVNRSTDLASRAVAQANDLRQVLGEARDAITDIVAFGAAQAELLAGADGMLAEALRNWLVSRAEFAAARARFETTGGTVPETMGANELMSELALVLSNKDRLPDWTKWCEARGQADAAGLADLADRLEGGTLIEPCKIAFRRAYARWWLPLAMDASDPLRRFAHWGHEDAIAAFRDLDTKAAELAPQEVMRRINHSLPTRDGVPRKSELGTLRHQEGLQRPSMAIRTLLGSLAGTLPKLAPCVLMSPLSIAQYLPAGQAVFDVVIFDEASQITTWDAVGAIARARQSIIVGDPKQLPPTNFFGRANDGGDDEDQLTGDMPSILDEVANAGIPTRRLNWHYRSRDEALIAFSNHFYYGGGLVTFPAPYTGSEAVRLHKINGTYARGGGRTNADEAKAVVAMIEQRLSGWLLLPEAERPTLGVITFNSQQQTLIQNLLDGLQRKRSDLDWFFDDIREEPVIVKNLENIQGDERDVIMFSITFGPDLAGKLSMAFGALNQDGGERRLNVAVTRARQEMHVFASILSDQIDLSRTRAVGVRDLKTFLDYAARGADALPAAEQGSLGPTENPFEEAVAVAFRAKGWEVRTQIGVSGFRIDLGIVNPDRGGAYLAGLECDGATYHSSATARDRDKVRQAVLEDLGWSILRIWSTDWFRDPNAVVARIHGQLTELLEADRARVAEEALDAEKDTQASEPVPIALLPAKPENGELDLRDVRALPSPNQPSETRSAFQPPSSTDLADPTAFFEARYLPRLRKMVDDVLTAKAPLPLNSLAREIARMHGWQRTGKKINDRVAVATKHADIRAEDGKKFAWPTGGFAERTPYRGLEGRWIQEVSRTEIGSLLDEISNDIAESEDPLLDLARELGIGRLSASAREYLYRVYQWHNSTME